MIEAVAFDLDGTLIDSTDAIVECFMETFLELGDTPPSAERIIETISVPLEDQFSGLTDRDPDLCARIYREHYARVGPAKTVLLPGVSETLRRFREVGIRVGFATSKSRAASEMLLEHLGVLDHFVSRLGPEDVVSPKPHPSAVLKSIEQLEATAESLVFVGDTLYDLKAAHAAEVVCLCVTTGYATREELLSHEPEAVFDHMNEVAAYVLERANCSGSSR